MNRAVEAQLQQECEAQPRLRRVRHFAKVEGTRCLFTADADANLDWLPERFCPDAGCPECGGAYVEIESVIVGPSILAACIPTEDGDVQVRDYRTAEPLRAVELKCSDGHLVRFDGHPGWTAAEWMCAGVVAVVWPYALAQTE